MNRSWAEILERAVLAFDGQLPSPSIEQTTADFYGKHPQVAIDVIAHVANHFKAGRVYNPWGTVRAEIQKRLDSPVAITSSATRDRDFAVQQAERWMRVCGHQFPTWAEVHDELFERGKLKQWPDLEQHMSDLYDTLTQQQEAA